MTPHIVKRISLNYLCKPGNARLYIVMHGVRIERGWSCRSSYLQTLGGGALFERLR